MPAFRANWRLEPRCTRDLRNQITRKRREIGRCAKTCLRAHRKCQFEVLIHGPTFQIKSRLALSTSPSNVPNTVIQGYGKIARHPSNFQQTCIPIMLKNTESRYSTTSQTLSQPPPSRAPGPTAPQNLTLAFFVAILDTKTEAQLSQTRLFKTLSWSSGRAAQRLRTTPKITRILGRLAIGKPIALREPKETLQNSKSKHCTTFWAFHSGHHLKLGVVAQIVRPAPRSTRDNFLGLGGGGGRVIFVNRVNLTR